MRITKYFDKNVPIKISGKVTVMLYYYGDELVKILIKFAYKDYFNLPYFILSAVPIVVN